MDSKKVLQFVLETTALRRILCVFRCSKGGSRMLDWYPTMEMRCGKCFTIVQEYWPNYMKGDVRNIIYYCMCGEEE